ncbi:MAG: hypothetical protein PQJ59_13640 [Spirochaetales bacterium]|nr:hypothetical protein [Spirochaetales bacterium]
MKENKHTEVESKALTVRSSENNRMTILFYSLLILLFPERDEIMSKLFKIKKK